MAEYTWDDIIINPTSDRAKEAVGKEVFYSDTPLGCVAYANDNIKECIGVLDEIQEEYFPFHIRENGEWACIIVKKEEPKPEYVPFESKKEFIEAFEDHTHPDKDSRINSVLYLSGFWLENIKRDNPVYEQAIAIQDVSVLFGTMEYSYPALLENFTFLDGSPCGKEVKDE